MTFIIEEDENEHQSDNESSNDSEEEDSDATIAYRGEDLEMDARPRRRTKRPEHLKDFV